MRHSVPNLDSPGPGITDSRCQLQNWNVIPSFDLLVPEQPGLAPRQTARIALQVLGRRCWPRCWRRTKGCPLSTTLPEGQTFITRLIGLSRNPMQDSDSRYRHRA
jgi:hypothetical protein